MYYTLHCFLFALHSNDITLCYSKIIKHFIALNCFAFLFLIDCNATHCEASSGATASYASCARPCAIVQFAKKETQQSSQSGAQ